MQMSSGRRHSLEELQALIGETRWIEVTNDNIVKNIGYNGPMIQVKIDDVFAEDGQVRIHCIPVHGRGEFFFPTMDAFYTDGEALIY